jgi:hypothetical protein
MVSLNHPVRNRPGLQRLDPAGPRTCRCGYCRAATAEAACLIRVATAAGCEM